MNPRPTEYESAGLPDCPTPQKSWCSFVELNHSAASLHFYANGFTVHRSEEGAYGHYSKTKIEYKKWKREYTNNDNKETVTTIITKRKGRKGEWKKDN